MRAFSLVELSIVLVILGLLTGGILAGQSLIRAAEIRAVISEYQRHNTALRSFQDKYMALPGDMRNATSFWRLQASGNGCSSNSAQAVGSPGSCDGDGNGIINNAAGAGQYGEIFQFWRQLALAGLVEGTYDGISGSASGYHALIGSNVPASKLSNAGWLFYNRTSSGDGNFYTMDASLNLFQFGTEGGGTLFAPAIRPEEAWNIDTKLDDGKPAYGRILAIGWNNICSTADAGATASANTNHAASYRLSSNAIECALLFR